MTFLTQNRTSMIVGTAILTIALSFGGYSFASHSFEAGVSGDNIPDNTHITLNGITLGPGEVMPLYDASPNYVSGHFLLTDECVPVDDDTNAPRVAVIAGHIDEHNSATHIEPMPLFYIDLVSNGDNRCVWHAHIPDPLNGGAPRVTDIAIANLGDSDVTFSGQHIVDINIQSVLGNIGDNPYTDGPYVDLSANTIYDLNDDEHDNDGLGHGGHE
ncbi:hypothetical protein [Nitrosopumilus sp. b2]|uniref:hypothetical protein n=1 Tax=Nitrosopumilus sp. b2 TaxID=2109908 RepID=UPI0015F769B5|nr:hypothetical protein [Nitrosopumilus sp. b2]KAF6246106.1 hypothetical protein C6989_02610 [Nitrosopumilus sp. b2]